MNEIRAVFFDLGGTLFSNHGIPKVCMPILEEAAHRLGLEGGVASIGRAFVDATRVTNERYVERSYYLHRSLFLESTDQLLELLGREKSSDFSEWFSSTRIHLHGESSQLGPGSETRITRMP